MKRPLWRSAYVDQPISIKVYTKEVLMRIDIPRLAAGVRFSELRRLRGDLDGVTANLQAADYDDFLNSIKHADITS